MDDRGPIKAKTYYCQLPIIIISKKKITNKIIGFITDRRIISVYLPINCVFMNYATISADVISYTSLLEKEKRELEPGIKDLIYELTKDYERDSFYGRLVQGDYIECALKSPKHALRIALLLKTYIKTFEFNREKRTQNRLKYFNEHGVRLAVAIAPLEKLDPQSGIIDG